MFTFTRSPAVAPPPQGLEELDLSLNPLGDAVSEPLSCLLARCPLLARLALQACGLTARCLQHHRLLLASALAGTGGSLWVSGCGHSGSGL